MSDREVNRAAFRRALNTLQFEIRVTIKDGEQDLNDHHQSNIIYNVNHPNQQERFSEMIKDMLEKFWFPEALEQTGFHQILFADESSSSVSSDDDEEDELPPWEPPCVRVGYDDEQDFNDDEEKYEEESYDDMPPLIDSDDEPYLSLNERWSRKRRRVANDDIQVILPDSYRAESPLPEIWGPNAHPTVGEIRLTPSEAVNYNWHGYDPEERDFWDDQGNLSRLVRENPPDLRDHRDWDAGEWHDFFESLIGSTWNQAESMCSRHGLILRLIAWQDGTPMMVTRDFRSNRINVHLREDRIIRDPYPRVG